MNATTQKVLALFDALDENQQKFIIKVAAKLPALRNSRSNGLNEASEELCPDTEGKKG